MKDFESQPNGKLAAMGLSELIARLGRGRASGASGEDPGVGENTHSGSPAPYISHYTSHISTSI